MRHGGIAYVTALACSLLVVAVSGPFDQRVRMVGHDDFSNIWAGPRVLLTGHDPYDAGTWYQSARDVGTFPPPTTVYVYPPWVAVALVPFAALPLPIATLVWTVGGIASAAAALWLLCRTFLPDRPVMHAAAAVTLVLSGPAISTLLTGQWSFLLVAFLGALVLFLRAGRPVAAGLSSLVMLAKPQLFLYAAPAFALRALWPVPGRDRRAGVRFVLVALGSGLVLVTVSAVLAPTWWPAWPAHVGNAQLVPESVTIPGLLFRTIGTPGLFIASVVLLGAVAVALRFHPRSAGWIPVWLALSITGTPYSNPYDLLLLIVPIVMTAGVLAVDAPRAAQLVFGIGTAMLLVVATLLHDLALLAYAPLVPATTFAAITAALWTRRRSVDHWVT